MNFRQRNDAELAELAKRDEERLLAYIVEARRTGQVEAAVKAAQVLAYSYDQQIRGFVHNRLGSKGSWSPTSSPALTLADAIASVGRFEGSSMGEFRALLFTIARRRIADYLRKGRVEEEPLEINRGERHLGAEGDGGPRTRSRQSIAEASSTRRSPS